MACRPAVEIGQARPDGKSAAARDRGSRTPRTGGLTCCRQLPPPRGAVLGDCVGGNSREGGRTGALAHTIGGGAGQVMRDQRTERAVGQHVARFILLGLYTGTRHASICSAALMPTVGRGHVDLERGVFYRRVEGARETKKRQPPVRLPDRLLAHLRRWERLGIGQKAVVEWNGKPIRSVCKAFAAAV